MNVKVYLCESYYTDVINVIEGNLPLRFVLTVYVTMLDWRTVSEAHSITPCSRNLSEKLRPERGSNYYMSHLLICCWLPIH